MKATIQERISPPASSGSRNYSNIQMDKGNIPPPDSKAPDFRSVLSNSADSVKKEREAKKNGDLTTQSEEDFFNKLSDQTEQRRQPKNELGKDDFLKLFVTQLEYQDPLNPDNGAEMAAKLAQFNGLEQMMNMNTTLTKMVESQNTSRSLQLVNYVGKEITVTGGRFALDNGKFRNSTFEIKAPAAKTTIQIRDSGGRVVREQEAGSKGVGEHKIEWNGKLADGSAAPNGTYTYTVSAKNAEDKDVPVVLQTKTTITGIDIKDPEGSMFTDIGKVKFADVIAIGSEKGERSTPADAPPPKTVQEGSSPAKDAGNAQKTERATGNQPAKIDPALVQRELTKLMTDQALATPTKPMDKEENRDQIPQKQTDQAMPAGKLSPDSSTKTPRTAPPPTPPA